ncbi:MAG: hypothetical protein Q4P13_05530 [Psychrobacter sp.]|nr:hypothetical protein [Psychrobacter sp.]
MNKIVLIQLARTVAASRVTKAITLSLTTGCLLLSQASNAVDSTTLPIDMGDMSITKHEIAVMHVLSEICPPMLNKTQKQRFYKSYNTQLHELMPTLDDPKAAIHYLSTQQDYRQILQGIRSWTLGFSKQENKALCEDLANAAF